MAYSDAGEPLCAFGTVDVLLALFVVLVIEYYGVAGGVEDPVGVVCLFLGDRENVIFHLSVVPENPADLENIA